MSNTDIKKLTALNDPSRNLLLGAADVPRRPGFVAQIPTWRPGTRVCRRTPEESTVAQAKGILPTIARFSTRARAPVGTYRSET
jgi:hypothetical protein